MVHQTKRKSLIEVTEALLEQLKDEKTVLVNCSFSLSYPPYADIKDISIEASIAHREEPT